MEQGPVEANIISQCLKGNMPLPARIQNAPELLPGLELYLLGFEDLKASRMTGFGLGPIWWNTIQDYCERKGLDEEQTSAMHFHVNVLDTEYLKFMSKKSGK